MKYTYIELNHYTRMPLTQGTHFSMEITNPIQIVLGTNGSGKSSLVKELTPYPPNPNDYSKLGSKILKIEHNNKQYTLKTVFSPSTKHSFIVDDENLNEGGTGTEQKNLIKEHFNFTQEISDLLHDDEQFTTMSPSRRKEWFISLCDTDYNYAIRQYNKLKEKHRDCLGALKLAKQRLTSETEKTLKSEEEQKLHTEVTELHSLLSHLLEFRKPVEHDTDTLDMAVDKLRSQVYRAAVDLQATLYKDSPYSSYSLYQLETLQTRLQQSLNTLNAFLDDYTHQYNENQDKIKILQQAEQNTIDTLQSQIQSLEQEKQSLLGKVFIPFTPVNTTSSNALDSFTHVKSILTELFTSIPSNKDKRFSNEELKKAKQVLSDLQIKKQTAVEYISNKGAQLKHLLSHKETQLISCVKCNHKFSLVYNEETCKELESTLQVANNKLEAINSEIKITQAYIDECLEYSALYRQYVQITMSHPVLTPYWDYVKDNQVLTDSPRSAVHLFNQFEQDLKLHVEIESIQEKIQKDQTLLDSLKNIGTDSLQSLVETNKRLYTKVGTVTDEIASKSAKLNLTNKLIQRKKTIDALKATIESLLAQHDSCTQDYIETMRREAVNALIRQLQSELGAKEHILHLAANQKSIIKNIEDQITELEADKEALAILINQLSPTDGLIAQGLLGFIRSFINQMNSFIDQVWAYPLTILPCDVQDNESLDLDYKFLVRKHDEDKRPPDVSKCSRGMQEIINLSFKITAMKYLNLLNTPMYLDEFGAAMDSGHRGEVISLIKAFNEQKTFSQMFIVSHDVTQYNSLPNSEVCVLCDTNIITPQKYNQHVTIK